MREKHIFCKYGCFSLSRYIKGVANHIFRHNRIFRLACMYKQPILTKQWHCSIFVKILYSMIHYLAVVECGRFQCKSQNLLTQTILTCNCAILDCFYSRAELKHANHGEHMENLVAEVIKLASSFAKLESLLAIL